VRELASLLASATSERNPSGKSAQVYRGRNGECAVILEAVWRLPEDETSTFLIAHEL
jgi:hypothetical protein